MNNKFKKIFVIFSCHLIENFQSILLAAAKDQYQILSLDIDSALEAKKLGIGCEFIEDWFTNEERVNLHQASMNLEEEHLSNFYEDPALQKIVQQDQVSFKCYWYEYSLQKILYEKFLSIGITNLKFIKFQGFGPAIHILPSDTFGNYWMNQKDSISIEPIITLKKNKLFEKIKIDIKKKANFISGMLFAQRKTNYKKTIVFSCTYEEFYYYKELVLALQQKTDNNIFILMQNFSHLAAWKLSKRFNLKIKSLNLNYKKIDAKYFTNYSIKTQNDNTKAAYHIDKDSFEYFEKVRWPSLMNYKDKLSIFLMKLNPSLVVFTALEGYRNQMLGEVASENSIKSISLPHGILASTRRGISTAKEYAVGNNLAKNIASISGINDKNIKVLKGLDPEHEYEMNQKVNLKNGFQILVLTNPVKTSYETRVYTTPPVGYKNQVQALQDISQLNKNGENINIILKTHPGWPESEIVEYADESLLDILCSPNTSLSDLMPQIDLVIGLNYYGAALVTAARNSKPIIFHYTAPISQFDIINPSYSIFLQSGDTSKTYTELFEKCNLVQQNKPYKEKLIKRSEEFSKKFIASENSIEVSDYLTSEYFQAKT